MLQSAANRPALRALDHREAAAKSQLDLERASIYPDVTLGLSYGRERDIDARNGVTALTMSLPLPLFRRNASGIGRATTELAQAQIDRQTAHRDTRAQVMALWQRWQSLRTRVEHLQTSVLPSLEDNQRLSRKAFHEGDIGLTQLLLVNRQVLDGRRDLLEVRTELRLAQSALEAAAGWSADEAYETAKPAHLEIEPLPGDRHD